MYPFPASTAWSDVPVPRVDRVEHVGAGVHPAVRDEDVPPHRQRVYRLLHGGLQSMVVQRVPGEHPERNRDSVVVHEEPELHDRLPAALLAHAELPQPLRDDLALRVQHIPVRARRLEVEVRHVVEHDLCVPPRPAPDAGVHASDYPGGVLAYDVQRVVYAPRIRFAYEGLVPILVLLHCGALGRRVEKSPVHEEPHDSGQVVPDLRRELDACEELVQPKRGEHRVEDCRSHALRLAEALLVAVPERDQNVLAGFCGYERLKRLDQRLAVAERLPQPQKVVGPAVVVPRERAYGQDGLAPLDDLRAAPLDAARLDEPQVRYSVVLEKFDCHGFNRGIGICNNYIISGGGAQWEIAKKSPPRNEMAT